jgi:formate hydrogenlyase transcriptional activator
MNVAEAESIPRLMNSKIFGGAFRMGDREQPSEPVLQSPIVRSCTEMPTTRTELQRQNDRLRLLLALTQRITSDRKLEELLHTVTAGVRALMQCEVAQCFTPDLPAGSFRAIASDSASGKQVAQQETSMVVQENSPARRAIRSLRPIVVGAMAPACGDEFVRESPELPADELFSHLCFVPVAIRGRVLGVLKLLRQVDRPFLANDVEFLCQALGQIVIALENALAYQEIAELKEKVAQEKLYLEEEIRSELNFDQIVGTSPALRQVLQMVETVAACDSTILLFGETGTGKELIARAIHDHSQRNNRTFVKMNCAAIPSGLLESELFGHERGAFTGAISQKIGRFELAHQGTLFLDEIGDIPLELQPKLLRALQEREFERLGSTQTRKVDVRLVAATNRNLERMIEDGQFRRDLYYRLNVIPIRIPSLRERREDVPLLVKYFAQKYARRMQKQIDTIPAAAMRKLMAWHWPGNVRELENLVERAVVLTRGTALAIAVPELTKRCAAVTQETADGAAERDRILRILSETSGRVSGPDGAAIRMGLKRTTLISRMKKLGINPRRVF